MTDVERCIREALPEVVALTRQAFEAVGGKPVPGSALDQVNLLGGEEVVLDYLRYGEPGLALDHLAYMIGEPKLPISEATRALVREAATAMGMDEIIIALDGDCSPCMFEDINEKGYYGLSFSAFELADDVTELRELQGGGYTWHGLVEAMVRLRAPWWARELEYDPEGDTFVVLSKNPAALRKIAALIRKAVDDHAFIREALANADTEILE